MNRDQCYFTESIVIIVVVGVIGALSLVGCGGGDSTPAESASVTTTAGEVAVGPSAGPDFGDMDGDGSPTANDAQLILNIVVDPDSYDVGEKYIADCETPQSPSNVNIGDALKVLRAAAGEIDWPFPGGGPPPPPIWE